MKSLSLNQMATIEGGQRVVGPSGGYCRSAINIALAGFFLGSPLVFFFGLGAAYRFCGGYYGGDSTCSGC